MKQKRRTFSASFNLEAVKGIKTITELAQEYQIHPVQTNNWKKTFLDRTAGIFEGDKKQEEELKRLQGERDELFPRSESSRSRTAGIKKN